jgi:hypothetical protein
MLGWIALAVLAAAGIYVVVRLLRSWGIAFRRFGPGSAPTGDAGRPGGEPREAPPEGPGPA